MDNRRQGRGPSALAACALLLAACTQVGAQPRRRAPRPPPTAQPAAQPVARPAPASADAGAAPAPPAAPSLPGPPPATVAFTGRFPTGVGHATARLRIGADDRQVDLYVPRRRGERPPLVLLFHGTYGGGRQIMDEGEVTPVADAEGFIVAAPVARYLSTPDWDHPGGDASYWETHPNVDPARNADLLLTQAVIAEAQRAYNVDPARVYVAGHSSGGFFALLAATALRDRVAAFAVNSAGLVRCPNTTSCTFRGRGQVCGILSRQAGWCSCAGPDKPTAIPTTGRHPPAFLGHGTDDPVVSVYYTCALAEALTAAGHTVSVRLRDGGHDLPPAFIRDAWPFLHEHPLR